MTTLIYGATTIELPDDMTWTDEFTWRAVEQATSYGVTGALFVQATRKLAGRTITLAGDMQSGWLRRDALELLMAAAELAGQQFELTLRGVPRTVMFDQMRGAVEATAVYDYALPEAGDFYVATVRFIEV